MKQRKEVWGIHHVANERTVVDTVDAVVPLTLIRRDCGAQISDSSALRPLVPKD